MVSLTQFRIDHEQLVGISAATAVALSSRPTQQSTREPTKITAPKTQPAAVASSTVAAAVSIPLIVVAVGAGLFAYFRYFRKTPNRGDDDSVKAISFFLRSHGQNFSPPPQQAFQKQKKKVTANPVFEMGDVYGDAAPLAASNQNKVSPLPLASTCPLCAHCYSLTCKQLVRAENNNL